MALTRKQLWIATYAVLCVAAVVFVMFGPKRRRNSAPDIPAPAAQLSSGSGCDASELPKALSDAPPLISDPSAPKDETPEMKRARKRITACVLRKLWPTASIQFRWDDDGGGHFDLVFPNNAYRRASVISMSQVSHTPPGVTFAAFVWLPHQRDFEMPPIVVARADADGWVNYVAAFAVDPDVRISEQQIPQWVSGEENIFRFTYEGDYPNLSGEHIAWDGTVDVAAAEIVKRAPSSVASTTGQASGEKWTLQEESMDGTTQMLRAVHANEVRNLRVQCERSHGTNCVVSASDLIDQMTQVRAR